ncbi:HNH endonuclease signature motif containing protein [Pectobacterium cacticida]|uniref:HNH endonuclease n=1 Tax=Pectobacterium cacticida TaxID=69221 RepID=UPI002FF35726
MTKTFSSSKRTQVLGKTNGRCAYCGDLLDTNNFTFDHITPKRRAGDNSIGNLFACCRGCNTAKGSKTIEQWRRFYAVKQVTGKTVFGQEQVDYLFTRGLFPALGADESLMFYFQEVGGHQ